MNDELSAFFVRWSHDVLWRVAPETRKNFSSSRMREPCSYRLSRLRKICGEISISAVERHYAKYSFNSFFFFDALYRPYTFLSSLHFVYWKNPSTSERFVSIEISRMCLSGRVVFIPRALDRSPISNAVYECRPVTSRVLDKNRLLGLREIGGNFNARTNRPHATSSHVCCTTARTVFRTLIDEYRRGSVFPFVQCYRNIFFFFAFHAIPQKLLYSLD